MIILDEPLNNLDYGNVRTFSNILTQIHGQYPSIGILLVTHCRSIPIVNKVIEICPKTKTLNAGNGYVCNSCFGSVDENKMYIWSLTSKEEIRWLKFLLHWRCWLSCFGSDFMLPAHCCRQRSSCSLSYRLRCFLDAWDWSAASQYCWFRWAESASCLPLKFSREKI